MSQKKTIKKNPVCVIWWQDAAYAYGKRVPATPPSLQATAGFIVSAVDAYTNIATNVNYGSDGALWPVDGFVIPQKAIVSFKKIGWAKS